jgi:hypothetical protein
MLVTFHTKAYADITMFGDVAVRLLKMMGLSGTVPSALMPEDIPAALQQLRGALEHLAETAKPQQGGSEDEPPVSLAQRAAPLIALLEAAQAAHAEVMWDS